MSIASSAQARSDRNLARAFAKAGISAVISNRRGLNPSRDWSKSSPDDQGRHHGGSGQGGHRLRRHSLADLKNLLGALPA